MKFMRRSTQALAALSSASFFGCSGSEAIGPSPEQTGVAEAEVLAPALPTVTTEDLCPPGKGGMRCFAKQVTSIDGNSMAFAPVPIAGLTAQDIQAAYK